MLVNNCRLVTNKKILIIVENLPLPFDRRVWQEATTLKESGNEVFIICPKGKGYHSSYELINGIHIYRHPLYFEAHGAFGYLIEYSIAIFWEFILAFKIYFRHGFDVIQACNPPDLIFLSAIPFKLLGKKFVFDHHDINPELYIAKFHRKDFFYKIILLLEKFTFRLADMTIATNESYKKIAVERGGIEPNKVHIVRSGPKLERLKLMEPKEELKRGKKYLISYVGVIGQQEGIDHLLEALEILINDLEFSDFLCIICGDGPALTSMKHLSHKKELNSFVKFSGRIPDNELMEVLNTADVCVNPDICNEMNDRSTMNKIMEYMALKKPIVQYDLKEGRFSAQNASLYAKPNNRKDFAKKILYLFNNPDLRKKMGEFGYNRIKTELSWSIEAPKYLKAYHDLF